jgi:amidohydrolase
MFPQKSQMITTRQIEELAAAYAPEFIELRRHLHAHPELSFQEHATSALIQQKLGSWGIPYRSGIAGTGVVAIIRGNEPDSRVIALRADMDALPIQEQNEVPYKSTEPGVMHACGHDVHTTCMLGAAKILQELQHSWKGTVKILFQPGEEKAPGGASLMIRDGALLDPRPSAILGMHVQPDLETGMLGFRAGKYMASADEIYITLSGKGGHAAAPHLTTDLILAAAELIVSLQQIVSRNNDPFSPSVLSICSVHGGYTTNVIPSEVTLAGTFRAMDETWRMKAHELIRKMVSGHAAAMGIEARVHIPAGYPCVYNDEALTGRVRDLAETLVGTDMVADTPLRMGSEDFAFYSREIPACFFRLGTGNKAAGISSGVHTPTFNIDERAIAHGMGIMAWLGATL